MFKLAHNGNILINVSETPPPSPAFIIEALEKSPYAECEINHDTINAFFKSDSKEPMLVVAKKVDAQFSVALSADKMEAIATLVTAKGGKVISLDDAKREIVKAGVTRGYKQAFLEDLLKHQFSSTPGSSFEGVVARGRAPQDGLPAKLMPHVQTLKERLKTPKLREDGTVDMRDFGALASVAPGTVLVTQRPATPGKEGYTVTGDSIAAKPGATFQLMAGEGTQISPHNPLELIATIAGCPSDIANGMRVDDVFTIADVTVKSGHVDFSGSVIVTHNVEPGMRIKAKGDITVMGSVESGELIAGGDIEIRQAAIGHMSHIEGDHSLSCRVSAKGDVHLTHGQYAYIEGTNIFIDRQSNHCDLKATKLIQIGQTDNPKGKLIGGHVLDAQMLIAGEIGVESGTKMSITLAAEGKKLTEQTDHCLKELAKTDEQLDALQQAIEKADQVKDAAKKKLLLEKIGATQLHYCQQAEQLEHKLTELDNTLHELVDNAKLSATVTLHPGVEVRIFDKQLKTTRSYPPCSVQLEESKIEIVFKTA
ncbi:DUF342 domain-containing protein [Pseudoalteromonas fenneropenaei]|uniref:DUF342 domain-containing protein n=1 Tax=Pseudoalteromonas fenneropenaei TaxID=1737459 RepID=A0ABV7CPK4_9GAMM